MSEVPRVSVIIPAYNVGHCLRACIESVLDQTYQSWAAIVIDDGSDDNTRSVAEDYLSDQIGYVWQSNEGQGAARNVGMNCARGELITFLDADDRWRNEFLERTVTFLDAHPEAVAVSTGFVVRSADGREVLGPATISVDGAARDGYVLDSFFDFWADHDHVRTGTVLIRRSVIEGAGDQRADLRISQDLEYWGYLATFGRWGFIPEPLWIGTSREAASVGGWLRKYQQRRRLCPSVEAWEARILPRLTKPEVAAFEVVRGRVAAGYAHHMILGGDPERAFQVVRNYGVAMPRTVMVNLLKFAARFGAMPWHLACAVVRMRERLKALSIYLSARVRHGHG